MRRDCLKVCDLCGKSEGPHWSRHWKNQHNVTDASQRRELFPGQVPVRPWTSNWFKELPPDLQKLFEKSQADVAVPPIIDESIPAISSSLSISLLQENQVPAIPLQSFDVDQASNDLPTVEVFENIPNSNQESGKVQFENFGVAVNQEKFDATTTTSESLSIMLDSATHSLNWISKELQTRLKVLENQIRVIGSNPDSFTSELCSRPLYLNSLGHVVLNPAPTNPTLRYNTGININEVYQLSLDQRMVMHLDAQRVISHVKNDMKELRALSGKVDGLCGGLQSVKLSMAILDHGHIQLPHFLPTNQGNRAQALLGKRKKKTFKKQSTNSNQQPTWLGEGAKFQYQEEQKVPAADSVVKMASAVQTSIPFEYKDATKKKWSAQWVKVSVRDLSGEDQHNLTKALQFSDSVRDQLNSLTRGTKSLPFDDLKEIIQTKVAVWRNKIKSRFDYFLQRFLYPLKELDVAGRRYTVFLENFGDPTVGNRSFAVHSDSEVHRNCSTTSHNRLFGLLETIQQDVETCRAILLVASQQSMVHPLRQQRLRQLISADPILTDLKNSLLQLVSMTEDDLVEDQRQHEVYQKKIQVLTTVPMKNYVRYKWLLLPVPRSPILATSSSWTLQHQA